MEERKKKMKTIRKLLRDDNAFGVVEIVLIIIVVVALVIIFREEIMSLVTSAFGTISEKSSGLIDT